MATHGKGKTASTKSPIKHHILFGLMALTLMFLPKPGLGQPLPIPLSWLDTKPCTIAQGITWGMPWPQGQVKKGQDFTLSSSTKPSIELQSWPLAFWPDGSVKWSAHACAGLSPTDSSMSIFPINISPSNNMTSQNQLASEDSEQITVHTGTMECIINKKGFKLIESIIRGNKTMVGSGLLLVNIQDAAPSCQPGSVSTTQLTGHIDEAIIEQNGPVRSVIRLKGTHTVGEKSLFPFVVRLYFYKGSNNIKLMHTFIYDADENSDFISGIGIRFSMPMEDEPYNRFIRFTGNNGGVFAEASQNITGLRRDAGAEARTAQTEGKAVTDIAPYVAERINYVPAFNDYTLHQPTPDGFLISKRTGSNHSWVSAAKGERASGLVYVGSPHGGIALGLRHFWEMYPSQIDVQGLASTTTDITLWMWAPASPAMDLRFYHDGMGQDTYQKQWDGLEVTYEDYEQGYGTPMGVARTHELQLWITNETPSPSLLVDLATQTNTPSILTSSNQHMFECGVFGKTWGLRDTAQQFRNIETALDNHFDFYAQQVKEHKWYGFWDFGDVMHSYDTNKHMWKYDVGGYAWDNSELSTDLWLWYYYLHTQRPDVYRMAEAMARHTGEVDVHHIGPFAPLGSRHNVMHWGCSAKQMRISTASNRRFLYYLTADERIGDLLTEQIDAFKTLQQIQPMRKRKTGTSPLDNDKNFVEMSFGTDWGAVAAAWFTQWERTLDPNIKQKLTNSMVSIAAQPRGFFTGSAFMDINSGKFVKSTNTKASASHLSAVFGLFEICAELNESLPNKAFKNAWLQYCTYYNAPADEQRKALGNDLGKNSLAQSHSRLTAYAAKHTKEPKLAERAWKEFLGDNTSDKQLFPTTNQVLPPLVLSPVTEAKGISTNHSAQWGLTAIQLLFLLGK
jgi:hypothetical protein